MDELIKVLEANGVDFDVEKDEIVLLCPCLLVPEEKFETMSQDEIYNCKDVTTYTDEAIIHISKKLDNWLIEIPSYKNRK